MSELLRAELKRLHVCRLRAHVGLRSGSKLEVRHWRNIAHLTVQNIRFIRKVA